MPSFDALFAAAATVATAAPLPLMPCPTTPPVTPSPPTQHRTPDGLALKGGFDDTFLAKAVRHCPYLPKTVLRFVGFRHAAKRQVGQFQTENPDPPFSSSTTTQAFVPSWCRSSRRQGSTSSRRTTAAALWPRSTRAAQGWSYSTSTFPD